MALYTIGDLHLHFQSPLKAQSQRKERVWKDHEARFQKNCAALLGAVLLLHVPALPAAAGSIFC